MFGKNPIRPVERDPHFLAVEEAFYTIQGEGPQGGRPALFIRLAGCNLACHFCDTQFETRADFPDSEFSVSEKIFATTTARQRELVVLTGGEPMRQNWAHLAARLLHTGTKLIQVETAGTCWQDDITPFVESGEVQIVCSPKTPKLHPEVRRLCSHWKYIVRGGEMAADGLPMMGTQVATLGKASRLYRPADDVDRFQRQIHGKGVIHPDTIWLSPCDEYDAELNKVNMELARDLCLRHGYRLSLQVHKIIGVA